VGQDGSLYVDQLEQNSEILRFAPGSATLERIPLPPTHEDSPALPLPDGRVLVGTRGGGRDHVMVVSAHKDPVPFFQTEESTTWPFATLGADRVVAIAGEPPRRSLAIAELATGRIVSRLTSVDANRLIESVAGSPDGRTIYVVSGGKLQSV